MGRAGCSGCNTKSLKRENKRQKQAYSEGFLFQGHVLNTNSLESLSKQSFVTYSKKMAYSPAYS